MSKVNKSSFAAPVLALAKIAIHILRLLRRVSIIPTFLVIAVSATAQTSPNSGSSQLTPGLMGVSERKLDLTQTSKQRYAVVIGNGEYLHAPSLPNAIADARLVSALLRKSGYYVQEYENLDQLGFETVLQRIIAETDNQTEVVFYYAGHGVQIGNSNRLIPVDAEIDTIYDLPFETVSLSSVLSIAGSRSRSLVVILDSCRDNPFPDRSAIVGLDAIPQELRNGFAAQDSPVNSLIIFSTSPGSVALDGEGANSPFTAALHQAVTTAPDSSLDEVIKDVRRRVYVETDGRQIPWESSSLIEKISFDSNPSVAGFQVSGATTVPEFSTSDASLLEPVALRMPLSREVVIGNTMDAEPFAGLEKMVITRAPKLGHLKSQLGQQTRGLVPLSTLNQDAGSLVYSFRRQEISATKMENPVVDDEFQLFSDGSIHTVQLTLDVDPCDFNAGDHLDPEGVGITRYPNEIDVEAALPACLDSVAREPEVGRYHYQLGRVYVALRNLDAAEISFKNAQQLDYTRAWHGLGMLEIARQQEIAGGTRSQASEKALALLAAGVNKGDPYAFHSLGILLLETSDDPNSRRQGFDLLSRAQEVGHTFSMNALGVYFLEKDSDHYDPERGIRYFRESAKRGDIYGYENMGNTLLTGAGSLKPDPKQALEWFTKASKEGHPTAPSSIGRMYNAGSIGGKVNSTKAIEWYDIGLSRGDGWAGANAAWIIANRNPNGFSPGDAAVRAAKAAALSNVDASNEAKAILSRLPARAVNAGAQLLMLELGEEVVSDGAFGPASEAAIASVSDRFDKDIPSDKLDRIVALAEIYWSINKFRADLY